ncbi:hypothetical protein [Actinoplanes sp. NPDC051494]|uniref:hypothetical protein n=1 Tax=Actinoplanes sp. NPDC051494 TaxID=3363907 RepID=UPI0037B9714D
MRWPGSKSATGDVSGRLVVPGAGTDPGAGAGVVVPGPSTIGRPAPDGAGWPPAGGAGVDGGVLGAGRVPLGSGPMLARNSPGREWAVASWGLSRGMLVADRSRNGWADGSAGVSAAGSSWCAGQSGCTISSGWISPG